MTEFMESVSFWYWLAFGLFLMVIEVVAPGVFFLWLGAAAIVTGLALLGIPDMTWQAQLILFAVVSVVSIYLGRRFVYTHQEPTDHPTLNRRGENFIGQTYKLDDATSSGRGRIRIGDTMWAVAVSPQGSDIAAGSTVTVVGVDGATLVVEESGAS